MRATEFIDEETLDELAPEFVRGEIEKQKGWKQTGDLGATATVWHNINDPNAVVKVFGAGDYDLDIQPWTKRAKAAMIAFVDFLVHHGYKSKHFPICQGINLDDPEVIQIKFERLFPIENDDLFYALGEFGRYPDRKSTINELKNALQKSKSGTNNSLNSLWGAMSILERATIEYSKKYNTPLKIDLHEGNWLQRSNGDIVMADPWFIKY